MRTFIKRAVLICLVVLPSIAFAADKGAEEKSTTPPPAIESASAVKAARIGYVDIAKIGADSNQGKALKARLTTKRNALQAKIDGKKKQVEKLKASIEAKIATMTPQQREAKSKEFQKKLEELQKLVQASEGEFFTLQESETKALYEEIEKSASAHGKANGFAVIVVKKELLYVGDSVDAKDVTEELIKALDQAKKK